MRAREVREGREFAFTLAGAFLIIGLLALRKARDYAGTSGLALAAIFLLSGVIFPGRLGPLRRTWMKIGELIGLVTTPLLMGVMYYLVFTPIGLFRRIRRHSDSANRSGWHQRQPLPPPSRMERQF